MDEEIALEITTEMDAENFKVVRVHLDGRLGQTEVRRFQSEIRKLVLTGYREFDLDFSSLQYIDSVGLAMLIPIYQLVSENQGKMRISNPSRLIRHILISAHIDDVIEIAAPS